MSTNATHNCYSINKLTGAINKRLPFPLCYFFSLRTFRVSLNRYFGSIFIAIFDCTPE